MDLLRHFRRSVAPLPREPGAVLFKRGGARYTLVEELGSGAEGEQVLLAWSQPRWGPRKRVELTVLGPGASREAVERLRGWYRLGSRLLHGHLTRVYGLYSHGGREWLASEHVVGCSLEALSGLSQARGWRPSPALLLYVGAQLAEALHHVHTQANRRGRPLGLLLGSFSPACVRLGREGQLKLGGVPAPRLAGLEGVLPARRQGRGSTEYAAPERLGPGGQERGRKEGVRSELFSLGLVLLELGTGRHLYELPEVREAAQGEALALRAESYRPEHVEQATEGLPPVLRGMVRRLLSRDPAARPESAAEVASTLRDVLGEPGEARLRGAGEVARAVQWVREEAQAVQE